MRALRNFRSEVPARTSVTTLSPQTPSPSHRGHAAAYTRVEANCKTHAGSACELQRALHRKSVTIVRASQKAVNPAAKPGAFRGETFVLAGVALR
jgi:hypothetical protein